MRRHEVVIDAIFASGDTHANSYLTNFRVDTSHDHIGVRTSVDGGPLILAWHRPSNLNVDPYFVSLYKFTSAEDFLFWWARNSGYFCEIEFLN